MNRLLFAGLIAAALAGGCNKKPKETPAPPETTAPAAVGSAAAGSAETGSAAAGSAVPTTEGSAAGSATGSGATEAAKAAYKPDELFKATAGQSRLDIMEKFKDGVTVTGPVKAIKDDPVGAYVIVFDAGDGKTVEATVQDPQPARDKKLEDGDAVTLTKCLVANPSDTTLPLTVCQVQ